MIKINIGCGQRNFGTDWIHIDGGDYSHLDSGDIVSLPFDDNSVDLIYASHVIEYFNREEVVLLLKEWMRVLRHGGKLRLAVPDFESITNLYIRGGLPIEKFLGLLYGKMKMREQIIYHKTVYDFDSIKKILQNDLGFYDVERYKWRDTCHSHYDDHSQAYIPHMDKDGGTLMSLNVECKK